MTDHCYFETAKNRMEKAKMEKTKNEKEGFAFLWN
jgi:hypothetical protein